MTAITIQRVLSKARKELEGVSDSAALDAELLLAHCLNKSRTYCHTWPEHELTETELTCFEDAITRRKDDYPVAYILGKKSFWTFDVEVTPDVLIPRPETELLVETAIEKLVDIKNPRILDLGTGSGIIALAIASERPDASIMACDFSVKALAVAERNAKNLKLDHQIEFLHSNWFSEIAPDLTFDLVISNPPYIEPNDPHLEQTIRHEPYSALVAKENGLKDIKNIIKNCKQYLTSSGWLLLEHGYDQHEKTQEYLAISEFVEIESRKDLAGNTRITLAKSY
ncbi:peptide chain release factor N(5)-glutamine methyltransferase [Cocleimonas sp. KMM 6892]|uniref:peptide chain release factor N(5)-glutamine methyltransferase n=1 Tax=unclassified Cocleimonas TaxID=2639732 RepID=UPI002DB72539|nr:MULTISPECIES: peptide chain release factor N(5)-glutamine methyltransferase [unclassified Cocleimonas]MEB8433837.1 peptide chain release factor N(5)-glutamine methyltransferase [Cocleimonas sp. KMM 6892]MEC4716648.1 peptide chain release factor N(5)-glutamine methyltransferase [Cocleimonas sp. KMM 6895]MEC4746197.1 peptide chain release factor N(5)-glutamine methyltransferase [Cocleimonas sp. KMM 6896]